MPHFHRSAALALFLAVCTVPASAGGPEVVLSATQIRSLGIATRLPVADTDTRLAGLAAQVVIPSAQQRVLSAPLAGLVEQVTVASQQAVRKGQVLVRLQSPALAEIHKGYLTAHSERELSRTRLERDERLFREGLIAESRLQATRAAQAQAEAALAERGQALRLAGLEDSDLASLRAGRRVEAVLVLRAPIDGVVQDVMVSAGQRVEAAGALLRLASLSPLWLEAQVPVAMLAPIREGDTVVVAGGQARARVIALSRNLQATSQTVLVRAQTQQGEAGLLPGQMVEVTIRAAATPGAGHWRLPLAAVSRQGTKAQVYVRTPRGFVAREVQVLREDAAEAVVGAALSANDEIAISGLAAIKAAAAGIGAP